MVEDRILYRGDPMRTYGEKIISIEFRENSIEDHDLWIGQKGEGFYVCLQRGILEEMARSSVDKIKRILQNISGGQANFHIEGERYNRGDNLDLYAPIAIACAQAKIKDEKLSNNSLLDELNKR